ncbi:monovalent cation:proton antiporter-2 (CPA2) family protein [Oceanomicrobium pacificus]|uniref:Potassium transporter n=1 Tax=Oceanomicrobium pacificus TaxID=2692916 RepID=A0A6B0TJ08_9RHOB|nr:monovalent cation:proton antiporter-2 (CPA2) family protein [Oceanomicrobium pacificus]MXU63856.1 potassium transporter [Oceanomicrobium pacificus]
MDAFLLQAFIFLIAAVIAVPLASKLGLGSVLGYLTAGVVIGPLLGIVASHETENIQHYAEFGVVMMLFLVGLELEPRNLWDMRHRLLGLGGLQVGLTTVLIAGVSIVFGLSTNMAIAVGLTLALSSTAIVLQTLGEKGLASSDGGRASFSVLLFQDIAVIPMLAFIPLLATQSSFELTFMDGTLTAITDAAGAPTSGFISQLPPWARPLVILAAVAAVAVGGHFLTRPVFRFIAASKQHEIFTAAALLLVIGTALLMTLVGLSPALGTFLAGVVLANSEYRHELEADIEPFKGLLLGVFFITVGAGINFGVLFGDFFVIVGLTLGLIALKAGVLAALAFVFRIRGSAFWLFTLGLAQAGEFGFVLLAFSVQSGVLPTGLEERLLLVVALSMLLTPALFIIYERFLANRGAGGEEQEMDDIDTQGTVIIAGLGRFGQIVNRMLMNNGHKTVVLDYHNEVVDGMRKFGIESYFGDPSRPDLLLAAGIKDAKAIVVAMDDNDKAVRLVEYVRREFPHVHVVARAYDREHTYRLYAAGARDIVRETFDSSIRAGRYTMVALGHHPFEAERAAREYFKLDRKNLAELARLWDPLLGPLENKPYMEKAREINARMDQAMMGQVTDLKDRTERPWTPPPKGSRADD